MNTPLYQTKLAFDRYMTGMQMGPFHQCPVEVMLEYNGAESKCDYKTNIHLHFFQSEICVSVCQTLEACTTLITDCNLNTFIMCPFYTTFNIFKCDNIFIFLVRIFFFVSMLLI